MDHGVRQARDRALVQSGKDMHVPETRLEIRRLQRRPKRFDGARSCSTASMETVRAILLFFYIYFLCSISTFCYFQIPCFHFPFSYHSFQTDPQAGIAGKPRSLPEVTVFCRNFKSNAISRKLEIFFIDAALDPSLDEVESLFSAANAIDVWARTVNRTSVCWAAQHSGNGCRS